MTMMIAMSLAIPSLLIAVNIFISSKSKGEREKATPFECGFEPKTSARVPFSIHFFLLAVIFLIFDVEITLILPMPILMNLLNVVPWTILSVMFVAILVLGTIHEWAEGSLEWSN